MTEEIRIDKQLFYDRLSHLISAWKADKRANDTLFGAVGSILVLLGRTEDSSSFQKSNAVHVCLLRPRR